MIEDLEGFLLSVFSRVTKFLTTKMKQPMSEEGNLYKKEVEMLAFDILRKVDAGY